MDSQGKRMKIYWDTFPKKYIRPEPNQFPTGSRVYKGFQGSGKTLSMVKYAFDISKAFPDALIASNIKINGISNYQYIANDGDLSLVLNVRNGSRGVLVLLDEAHLYFNKKSGISLDVLTAISQQRKDRRRLVFSSQIWEELDVSLRKQVKEVVNCRCFLGKFQFNTIYDGEGLHWDKKESAYVAPKIRTEIFKHYQKLYDSYDTFQKIISNSEYSRIPSQQPQAVVVQTQQLKRK